MKDEEGRRVTTVEAFNVAEKRVKKLNAKLIEPRGRRKALRWHWKGRKDRPRLSARNSARPRMNLLLLGSKSNC